MLNAIIKLIYLYMYIKICSIQENLIINKDSRVIEYSMMENFYESFSSMTTYNINIWSLDVPLILFFFQMKNEDYL